MCVLGGARCAARLSGHTHQAIGASTFAHEQVAPVQQAIRTERHAFTSKSLAVQIYAALFERDRLKRFLRRGDRRSALPSGSDDLGPGSAEPEPGEGNSGFKSPAGGLG